MVRAIRIALNASGVALGFGFSACAHTAMPNSGETDTAGSAASDGSAGSSGNAAGDAGPDAALDSGVVEQVDASTSCSDLFTLARHQLDDATACNLSVTSGQCTALVPATCGCAVSVNSQTSSATESYLDTLSVIQAKMCGGTCPPQFCEPPGPGQCVAQSGSAGGVCVHRP
jgi:hypothetical protein